jgi:hypothetical protein
LRLCCVRDSENHKQAVRKKTDEERNTVRDECT